MENKEFNEKLLNYTNKIGINISSDVSNKFHKYMNLLLEWNEKINLTAITEPKEIILKHFIDSISINRYIKDKELIFDIGTGAGFPGIPLKLINEDKKFVLIDSLRKRINFLEEIKLELNLNKIDLIHARVEDLGKNNSFREKADVVVSRAVANLSVLAEYMLPFVKEEGYCICMKGPNIDEEIKNSQNAIEILGGKIETIDNLILPEGMERNIIIIKKVKSTPNKYPRKAGIPIKQPL